MVFFATVNDVLVDMIAYFTGFFILLYLCLLRSPEFRQQAKVVSNVFQENIRSPFRFATINTDQTRIHDVTDYSPHAQERPPEARNFTGFMNSFRKGSHPVQI
jgi:hypothetical protein